jgi:hypothetical protein
MIKKTIRKFINWAFHDDVETVASGQLRRRNVVTESTDYLRSQGMSFTLYAAEGGTVIETSMYNDKTDRNENRLYLISEGEDFGSMLAQIVSTERMKSWH